MSDTQAMDRVGEAVELLRQEDPAGWLDLSGWRLPALVGVAALLLFAWVRHKVRRWVRRRRGVLHPNLQKYAGAAGEPDERLTAQRRAEAARVVATSSGAAIAGYEIMEQVEAVFVDGFRRPEEALEGLKAVAAMKGANAVTNVRHERNAAGRCSAAGDAVIVRKLSRASIAPPGQQVLDDNGHAPAAEPSDRQGGNAGTDLK